MLFFKNINNYICEKWKFFILIFFISLIIIPILLFIIWIIISYYILIFLKKNIEKNYYYNNYTNKIKNTLESYGDLHIKNIYLVRQHINYYLLKLLNVITFFEVEKNIKKYIKKNKCNEFIPYHTYFIIEVELPNKFRKLIVIEKNNSINISTSKKNGWSHELIKIKIKKNKYTINSLLKKTKKRLGTDKYFNWHIYKNNCQNFTEEILRTLNKKNKKYINFIYQNDFVKNFKSSDFNLHVLNCCINIFNIFGY